MAYCFAWDQNVMGMYGCNATMQMCDGQDEKCPFFKTMEQHMTDRKAAFDRIANIPEWQQTAISEKYYRGEFQRRSRYQAQENQQTEVMGVV